MRALQRVPWGLSRSCRETVGAGRQANAAFLTDGGRYRKRIRIGSRSAGLWREVVAGQLSASCSSSSMLSSCPAFVTSSKVVSPRVSFAPASIAP